MLWTILRIIWKLPSKNDEIQTSKTSELALSGQLLVQDYLSNAIKADHKYLRKVIEVSGRLYSVQQELGDVVVYLESGLIRCECGNAQSHELEILSANNEVKVKGVVLGLHVGKVVLTGCRIY